MKLRSVVDRFYLDMVINELRLANDRTLRHVTYNSLLYLDMIAYQPDCTVSSIADALHIAKSAVTLKVKELERQGLVTKTQSAEDRRVYHLAVNPGVLEAYRAYDRVLYRALDEIETRYSQDELQILCGMLDTINRHFEQENQRQEGNRHELP